MAEEPAPRTVNIVNFVRQNEPSIPAYTPEVLYQTVVEQVAILKRCGLKGTFHWGRGHSSSKLEHSHIGHNAGNRG